MEYKEIVIKPINREKFSGIGAYKRSVDVFGAQLSKKTGWYKTGLSKKDEQSYEEKLDLKKGTLSINSPYWGELSIRVNKDKDTTFVIVTPEDELVASILYNRSNIAKPGEKHNSFHDYYIYDPETEAKKESLVIDYEIDAIQKFSELNITDKKDVLRLYGKRGVDTVSENIIKKDLFKEVKSNPKGFLEKLNDPSFETKALIYKLIDKNEIKRTANNQYMFGEDHIGSSLDDVIAFINDPKNQKIKLSLKAKAK